MLRNSLSFSSFFFFSGLTDFSLLLFLALSLFFSLFWRGQGGEDRKTNAAELEIRQLWSRNQLTFTA